jgi:hypothetical protein
MDGFTIRNTGDPHMHKLATTLILVLTTSLTLISSASARFIPEPPASGSHPISKAVASGRKGAAFTAQGSPLAYVGTRYAGDPAAHRAQPRTLGGGGSYATPPVPGSNTHVPGLQP